MKIEGIPAGWDQERVGQIYPGEYSVNNYGDPQRWENDHPSSSKNYVIIRKIEKPKQYRPFANAAEFEPFRDRWWKKTIGDDRIYPPCYYNDSYSGGLHFDRCFIDRVFDDGTPFGIEVTE